MSKIMEAALAYIGLDGEIWLDYIGYKKGL